ncbi:MAG TPA: adenosylcobinamide-GDP ribazoletransferase [Paludibacter sp.]|nr:adenosylcobinamide-GDP ribazoletransferase [Paludibacter sp.]
MKKILLQLAAAITFFTRLPLWKVLEIPSESFKKIICFWPFTGWITAGFTALAWLAFSMVFPPILAVILAFCCKVLLTGGLHEDGLGDFFDGFGGGRTKEDVLRIMKDSHVGSYALIGMIFYYLLLINTVVSIPKEITAIAIFAADPFSKMLTALMMNLQPYARTEQESKSKTIFEKLSPGRLITILIFGLLPIISLLEVKLWLTIILPIATVSFVFFLAKKRIGGYTGDICGATALLCELSFYLSFYVVLHL